MTERPIKNAEDVTMLMAFLGQFPFPYRVTITKGADRSGQQNKLAFKWYKEIAEQMGDRTSSEVRAHCKFYHGVKMLVTENDEFREQWSRLFRDRYSEEEKLELMVEPTDYPVTRIMGVKQMTAYLEAIIAEYTPMGVQLTIPTEKL